MDIRLKVKNIFRFIGKRGLFWICLSILCGLLLSALELIFSLTLQVLIFGLEITPNPPQLPFNLTLPHFSAIWFSFVLLGVGVTRSIVYFFISQSAIVSYQIINTRLRLLSFYELLKLKSGFLSLSEINNKISEIFPKAVTFCHSAAILLPHLISSTLLFLLIFKMSPFYSLIGLIGIITAGIFAKTINKKVLTFSSTLPIENESLMNNLTKVVKNWFFLKAIRRVDYEHNKIVKNTLLYSGNSIRADFFVNLNSIAPQIFGSILFVCIIFLQIEFKIISSLEFMSFLYLLIRFVQSLGTAVNHLSQMYSTYPHFLIAYNYFFSFDEKTIEKAVHEAELLNISGKLKIDHFSNPYLSNKVISSKYHPPRIEAQHLLFSYDKKSSSLFNKLSFKIEPGSQFGIVGNSGKGKSTLLALIMGIIEPDQGFILINDKLASEYFSNPSNKLGYVGADSFLIKGSLRENLLYGCENDFSDKEIESTLEQAHLLEFIKSLPNGLSYKISENGEGLSTGQKQRLSLARALLSKPSLLFLDEISANLDEKTEQEIAQSILKLKGVCTTIIVSHRQGILKYIDNKLTL